jgi:FO synthase
LKSRVQGPAALEFSEACRRIREGHPDLYRQASELRDTAFGSVLTYSPKVFLPVTNLCRDRCSYCTFRKGPKSKGAHTMSPEEISATVIRGHEMGCVEALLCLGDRPEAVFPSYRRLLGSMGYATTTDYLVEVSQRCLELGMLPHTNAGILRADEMARLRPFNVSMGLMLENVSPRLCEVGGPHESAPDKRPEVRLQMIREAGELRIPFTSGLLVGIGETVEERVETLFALRELQQRYGHIQEVIVQIFRAKDETRMADFPEVSDEELFRTVAVSRLILGGMNVQAPPNLTPFGHQGLIRAGINDWGGISPLTQDFINPEAPWPHLEALSCLCREQGYTLRSRLPIYPQYLAEDGWIDPALREPVARQQEKLRMEAHVA